MKTTQIIFDWQFISMEFVQYVITTGCLKKKYLIIFEAYFYEQSVVTRGRETHSATNDLSALESSPGV